MPATQRVTVADMQRALTTLEPTDELEPNAVGNLTVWRGHEWGGWVNVRSGEVEWLTETWDEIADVLEGEEQ